MNIFYNKHTKLKLNKKNRRTWLANPIPKPRKIRPIMSIATFWANPLIKAPAQNRIPPESIESLLPNFLVTVDATREDTRAAKYNDDVNIVSVWLSNLQYWLVELSAFCFLYTDGKNLFKNVSIDVTPPDP